MIDNIIQFIQDNIELEFSYSIHRIDGKEILINRIDNENYEISRMDKWGSMTFIHIGKK